MAKQIDLQTIAMLSNKIEQIEQLEAKMVGT